jgi:hypothetical protein
MQYACTAIWIDNSGETLKYLLQAQYTGQSLTARSPMTTSEPAYPPQRLQLQWPSRCRCASASEQKWPILQASPRHAADEQQRVKYGW